jgi:hypothetical protein
MRPEVTVRCDPTAAGWGCRVRVGDDAVATEHDVALDRETLARLAPPGTTPEDLVAASFAFLLEREPRESIMAQFELPIITRFFADYETEIAARLAPG